MNASQLRARVQAAKADSHFFSRRNMAFNGDTMKNYGVRKVQITVNYDTDGAYVAAGETIEAFELFRKRPVKHGITKSAYFRADTFTQTFPKE